MTSDAVDLSNCDREPIHTPGAIQPHGVLTVCRADDLTVTHVSENVERVLGVAVSQVIGRRIGELFLPDESAAREAVLRDDIRDGKPVYLFTIRLRSVTGNFDAIAHRSNDWIYLELEPTQEVRDLSAPELYRLLQGAATRLSGAGSVDDLYRVAAEHVREINGFDRVMVYRFDEEWNGQVVAESRRDDLEPFLGLHYPASDIPRQARELYVKNWLRFIADRDYVAARVVPETGPDSAAPLDMSFCVLRSVSPIHLEYLRNMGVAASMSISLVRDGRLWGLIACHHYSPRFVPYDVRTACELLGRLMSLTLSSAEDRERDAYRTKIRQAASHLIESAERSDDLAQALIESTPGALDFLDADGAALCNGDDVWRIGQTPSDDEIRRLTLWLAERGPGNVFCTDRLPDLYGSELLGSIAAGLMAVSLGSTLPHYLLWFRAEQVRTVDWAGDPAKSVVKSGEEVRLSPRGSFALWKETVRGRSRSWSPAEEEAAASLRDGLMRLLMRRTERLIAANLDLRAAGEEREKLLERERAARGEIERINRMKDEFVATLSHELRSPLNAILGWSQLLAMREDLDEETAQGLDIIERNARSQAHMIEDLLDVSRIISGKLRLNLQEVRLPSLVEAAVQSAAPTAAAKGVAIERRIDELPGIQTTGDPGRLQQILNNLLSNAVKFTPSDGRVRVILERAKSHVELTVADTGQGIPSEFLPYVFDRFRQADGAAARKHGGLGLGLSIVRNLVELHGGTVQAHSAGIGRGATYVVSLPIRAIQDARFAPRSTGAASAVEEAVKLDGVRILSLDDEHDARQLVKRLLEDRGAAVVTVATVDEALQERELGQFDVLISDIGMPGDDGFVFIRRLRQAELAPGHRPIPAIALTAYARPEDRERALAAGYQAHVAKPVESGALLAAVAALTGRG